MTVVGIAGSPRSLSSSAILVEKALEGARSGGAETVLHRLCGMTVNGCRACYSCRDGGVCVQDDDMRRIYADLKSSGGVVLGSPVYMFAPTSQTKAFADRLFALLAPGFASRLGEGVPLLTVYTQGAEDVGLFTPSFDALEGALDMIGLHPACRLVAGSLGEPSDLEKRPELLVQAFEAGRRLAAGQAGLQSIL